MIRKYFSSIVIFFLLITTVQACTTVDENSFTEDSNSNQNAQVSVAQSGEDDKDGTEDNGTVIITSDDQPGEGSTGVGQAGGGDQSGTGSAGTGQTTTGDTAIVSQTGGGGGEGTGPVQTGGDETGSGDTLPPPEVDPNGGNTLPGDGFILNIGNGDATLTIVNNSILRIFCINIVPATESNWGENILQTLVINSGTYVTIWGITPGTYNLRVCDSSQATIQTWMGAEISDTATWTITEPQLGSSGGSYLTVENQTEIPVQIINITPSSSSDWGVNYLNGYLINPGMISVFQSFPAGNYNLRAVDINSIEIETAMDFPIDGSARWILGEDEVEEPVLVDLTINNRTDHPITEVYYSLSSDNLWGPNRLPSGQSINQWGHYTFTDLPAGIYDIRVVFTWDYFLDQMLVDMTSNDFTWPVTEIINTELATLNIINRSNYDIDYLIFSPANVFGGYAQGNALNGEVIAPNDSFSISNIEQGSYYIEARSNSQFVWNGSINIVGFSVWFIRGQYSHAEIPLTITNNSQYTITLIRLYNNSVESGENLIGNQPLLPGESRTIYINHLCCTFNARDNHQMLIESTNLGFISGTNYWTITGESLGTPAQLLIENQTNLPISRVYISPSTSSDWGEDMLTEVLTPGETFIFSAIPPGVYDLKFEGFFGVDIQTIQDISVNGMTVVTVTGD